MEMKNKPRISIHYQRKRNLAGSALNNSEPTPQQAEVPLARTEREADMLAAMLTAHRTRRKTNAREEYGLSRREIAALLDKSAVASLSADEVRLYRRVAAGNLTEEELGREMAAELGVSAPETALEVELETCYAREYIADIEQRIIQRAEFCGERFRSRKHVEHDSTDHTRGEDESAQNREIASSGGAAIGGSVIEGGKRFGKEGTTFRPVKGIKSFEKGGRIRTVRGGSPDPDETGGETSDHDDYGEESGA